VILSFFSLVDADVILPLPKTFIFSPQDIALIKKARAIILPSLCRSFYYWFCKQFAPVFPCMDTRFHFSGKAGHTFVFELAGVPYPPTKIFKGLAGLKARKAQGEELYTYPFVVKWHWGGGGAFVHLVNNEEELREVLLRFKSYKKRAPIFVIQPYIEHEQCDLRVVVIGSRFLTYWRCQETPGKFRSNVSKGAKIYYHLHPELEKKAVALTRQICRQTGINLAAFDVIFSTRHKTLLFLEINYGFGVQGIGGYQRFKQILNEEVQKWVHQVTFGCSEGEEKALKSSYTT
jgi:ribosomal protein S6--L-glutamate ligase